jgi:hypothetical protein
MPSNGFDRRGTGTPRTSSAGCKPWRRHPSWRAPLEQVAQHRPRPLHAGYLVRLSDRNLNGECPDAASGRTPGGFSRAFSPLSALPRKVAMDTGDCCLKARRIPLGLLYIATLILVIVLIPLIQFSSSQSSTLMHRQSSAMTLRLDKMKL